MSRANKLISISTGVLVAFLTGGVFWLSFDALKDLAASNGIASGMAGTSGSGSGKTRFGLRPLITLPLHPVGRWLSMTALDCIFSPSSSILMPTPYYLKIRCVQLIALHYYAK